MKLKSKGGNLNLLNSFSKAKIIRYDNQGFPARTIYSGDTKWFYRNDGTQLQAVQGCFAFCRFVDFFALTGSSQERRYERENILWIDKDVEVYSSNIIPNFRGSNIEPRKYFDKVPINAYVLMPLRVIENRSIEVFLHKNKLKINKADINLKEEDEYNHFKVSYEWSEIILPHGILNIPNYA